MLLFEMQDNKAVSLYVSAVNCKLIRSLSLRLHSDYLCNVRESAVRMETNNCVVTCLRIIEQY